MESAEIELFTLFEMTPDLVCIAGKDGFFRKVNPAVIKKLGYTEKELFALPIASFIHPDDKEFTHHNRKELLNGKVLLNFENRYIAKNGQLVWLEWTSIYFPNKEIVFAIAKDVTERKHIEKVVEEKYKKYKGLTAHFKNKIEKERKYFAYELHEELAQLVAAVKMDIEWVANNETQMSASSKSMIEHALAVSKIIIKTIQKISFSISPNMLSDFGLNSTIEWLCNEFYILNEIPCSFESAYNEERLTQEMKTDFFRICQESLTNVIDHVMASNVKIRIAESPKAIQLCSTDDGRGFDAAHQMETPGLINVREHASSINGHLAVQNEIGQGTRICVTIEKENNLN
ncbi:PAS domain S-box protein [Ginsengibacter hankyongi]|uniref:histidine kinase n=1 Tax=Ginsengibacter hankyongi TaxID=2607284 RepID=A0A5J5IJB1_9BACT|nr:PAS domain S-box protein [Ginsengibacter hankyongi]KAA9041140.1 PAS domain S-box protein [Ginsengibacter hankyongi]